MTSIAQRLTIGLVTLSVLMGLTCLLVMHHLQNKMLVETISLRLNEDMQALMASLRINESEVMHRKNAMPDAYHNAYSGRYYIVRSEDGEIRSRSLWDTNLKYNTLNPTEKTLWEKSSE